MHVHFYTRQASIYKLNNGIEANVWNKDEAGIGDVHISLNVNEYDIKHVAGSYYKARQISSNPWKKEAVAPEEEKQAIMQGIISDFGEEQS